jgi:hypothetical protein
MNGELAKQMEGYYNNEKVPAPTPHFEDFGRLTDTYHKVLASDLITHSVMTPCNRSQYVQVIGDPQNPDQVIVVQRVERNVRHVL